MHRTVLVPLLLVAFAVCCSATPRALPCFDKSTIIPAEAWLEVKDCPDFSAELHLGGSTTRVDISNSTVTGRIMFKDATPGSPSRATFSINDTVFGPSAFVHCGTPGRKESCYLTGFTLNVKNLTLLSPRTESAFLFGPPSTNSQNVVLRDSRLTFDNLLFNRSDVSHVVLGGYLIDTQIRLGKWYGMNRSFVTVGGSGAIHFAPRETRGTTSLEIANSAFNFHNGLGMMAVVTKPRFASDPFNLTVRCVDLPRGGTLLYSSPSHVGVAACTLQSVSVNGTAVTADALVPNVCDVPNSALLPAASDCDLPPMPEEDQGGQRGGVPPRLRPAAAMIGSWFGAGL